MSNNLCVALSQELGILSQLTSPRELDLIITNSEINERHGTGVLLQRVFGSSSEQIISLRSRNLYDGKQLFGKHIIQFDVTGLSQGETTLLLQRHLGHLRPRRILAIPYFPDDFLLTIAAQELFNVPLCTYIMDDQNINGDGVGDDLVTGVLTRSRLCLGISPQLCDAYQKKYNVPFWFVPPVVDHRYRTEQISQVSEDLLSARRGIMIGNVWGQSWLDNLRKVTRTLNVEIDWYGKPHRDWVKFDEQELEADGIYFRGFLESEQELIDKLKTYPYAVVPTGGGMECQDDRPDITTFSLPSRIPFIVASSQTPILVVGGGGSCAVDFVQRFGLGLTADYQPANVRVAIEEICQPKTQLEMRNHALEVAKLLTFDHLSEWVWQSLEQGRATDFRFESLANRQLQRADVVVTTNEVTPIHGTGVLVKRVFPNSAGIISIRSHDHYGGSHDFGQISFRLSHYGHSRPEVFGSLLKKLGGIWVDKIMCVPYHPDDLLTAIALRELYHAPLATWIMDDQNICVNNIPDPLMREFLEKCDLRLATHPELRDAYEQKYGLKFWLLPAVAPKKYLELGIQKPHPELVANRTGTIIGNIWSKKWFELICKTVEGSHKKLDWYGPFQQYDWMKISVSEMRSRGINPLGLYPEDDLVAKLKHYPYLVVPTGTMDYRDDHPELSTLSLPGRTIFALVAANIPVIVLGSPHSSLAHFVRQFGIGFVSDYDPKQFAQMVEQIVQPDGQRQIRSQALAIAPQLCDQGITDWIWDSLRLGKPADNRFESLWGTEPIAINNAKVVITANEMNYRHGTDALVKRVFPDSSSILSIRSRNHYNGEHRFGLQNLLLDQQGLSRLEIFQRVANILADCTIERVFCIPFHSDELQTALAIKELFNVPLATWIMDDQNVSVNNIPDALMAEFLGKCSIRFATHPELRGAYEKKYDLPFWILPAVAPHQYLETSIQIPDESLLVSRRGVLIGNIWSQNWFDLICHGVGGSGNCLDWYADYRQYHWMKLSQTQIREKGLNALGLLPEQELVKRLKQYPYIVVPTDTLDERDDRQDLATLSLPGRTIFAMVCANLPVIVMGHPATSIARFVRHFQIGLISDYTPESFADAVNKIMSIEMQQSVRQRAVKLAQDFCDQGIDDWVWQSFQLGRPINERFENLFSYSA